MEKTSFLKSYSSSLILIIAILIGSFIGLQFKEKAVLLKPLGDIFLNLLFTVVVPLVFFSISSAVAKMSDMRRLGKIVAAMLLVFVVTGIISSVLMIVGVKIYPPAEHVQMVLNKPTNQEQVDIAAQIVRTFTVSDFKDVFSTKNILALIIFAFLIGLGTASLRETAKPFAQFLMAGNEVMTKIIGYVMLYAPIGLGAYFAYLVGSFGGELFGSYFRAMALYYPLAIFYFIFGSSFYVWLAGGINGFHVFWRNILPPALTAWGTGSGLATLPVNLDAAKKIGIPEDVREIVVNIGASIHSDGSCLAAVIKIALLFGIFGMPLTGIETYLSIIAVALLCGTVISGIPSGGILGELLIVTMFGFPIEAMPIITLLGTLVDPPATMINVVGDNVCGMLVSRMTNGAKWLQVKKQSISAI